MSDAAGAALPPPPDRGGPPPSGRPTVGRTDGGPRGLWARAVEHRPPPPPAPTPTPRAAPARPRSAPGSGAGAWAGTTTARTTTATVAAPTTLAAPVAARAATATAAAAGRPPGRPAAVAAGRPAGRPPAGGRRPPAARPAPPRPAFPRREHRLSWLLGEISVGQILCCQLAVVAVALVRGHGGLVTFCVVTAATATVLAATVRVRGMWLFQWLDRYAQFTTRVGRQRAAPPDSPAMALLSPHTTVESVTIDGVPAAVIHHPGGVTALLAPHTPEGPHDEGATLATLNLSSPAPLLPAADPDSPAYSVQLVVQADPVGRDADWSRRALPRQHTWIALQALRTADSYQDEELLAALTNAVRRLLRRLAREELPTRTLDPEEALALVRGLARVGTDEPAREGWRSWETPSLAQACFRLTGWHELPEATRRVLLARLLLLPGQGTIIAVAARRTDGRPPVAVDMVVRIADASRELLDSSADLLAFAVAEARVRMERLDGAHGRALVASLPLGGFLPGALTAGVIR